MGRNYWGNIKYVWSVLKYDIQNFFDKRFLSTIIYNVPAEIFEGLIDILNRILSYLFQKKGGRKLCGFYA